MTPSNGARWPSSRPISRNVAVSWPWAMHSDTNLWHPSNSRKASNSRDIGNSKDPISDRNASLKQSNTSTISIAKTPATAGSLWKSYKNCRKWSQKYSCDCDSDKKVWWSWKVPKWSPPPSTLASFQWWGLFLPKMLGTWSWTISHLSVSYPYPRSYETLPAPSPQLTEAEISPVNNIRVRSGSAGCGVAQIAARRLAVRQARVRISARHPRGGPPPSGSN